MKLLSNIAAPMIEPWSRSYINRSPEHLPLSYGHRPLSAGEHTPPFLQKIKNTMNLCSAFEASKSNHHLHPTPTFPKIMAPPGQIEWCWKMTQNGRAYLNSRRQEPNEDIVLKHFLLSDIRLNIISWKFQVDISYSYGDMAFWNVYFKDQQYISRPSDYVYSAFYRFRWSAFRILQIPVVRIPSFRVLQIPQYTDSIPFRILLIPFHSAEYRRP